MPDGEGIEQVGKPERLYHTIFIYSEDLRVEMTELPESTVQNIRRSLQARRLPHYIEFLNQRTGERTLIATDGLKVFRAFRKEPPHHREHPAGD